MVNNSRTSSTMATLGTEESGHYADHNMFVALSSCVLYPIMVIQSEIILHREWCFESKCPCDKTSKVRKYQRQFMFTSAV